MVERNGRRLYVPDLMQNTSGPNAGRALRYAARVLVAEEQCT